MKRVIPAIVLLGLGAPAASPVAVAVAAEVQRQRYAIPPQPLSTALEAFAATSGLQILYDRPTDAQSWSPGATGLFTSEEALAAMLKGTGLVGRFGGANDIVLTPVPPAGGASPGRPPDSALTLELDTLRVEAAPMLEAQAGAPFSPTLYGGLLRTAVRTALQGDKRTATGDYAAVMRLWVAPSGRISRLDYAQGSGDPARDAAIETVLQGLVVSEPPPPRLRQPVVIAIRSLPAH
ncbi:TonB C-terminal domain-containing protein [Caulobacter sp.]|uniref:TonB C-terminal domain-containing protein n=1 Tax=Caulobacter sp. TaxID=78 RepID=UPI003BAEA0D5